MSTTNDQSGGTGNAPSGGKPNDSKNTNPNPNGHKGYHGKKNIQNNKHHQVTASNPKDWKGTTEEIGAVLGLRYENLQYKKPYKEYMTAVRDYIMKDNAEFGKYLGAPFMFGINPLKYFRSKKEPEEPEADEDGNEPSKREIDKYHKRLDRFWAQEDKIESMTVSAFTIVEGNCSDGIKEQLRSKDKYLEKKMDGDILWIMGELKEITSGLELTTNKCVLFHDALYEFMMMHQWESESDEVFKTRFEDSIDTLNAHGGMHVFASPQILGKDDASEKEIADLVEQFKTITYVKKLNRSGKRYGGLLGMFHEQDVLGNDAYPTTMADATTRMVTFRSKKMNSGGGGSNPNPKPKGQQNGGPRNHASFAQQHGPKVVAGTDGNTYPDTLCYNCQNKGHISTYCPEVSKKEGVTMAQVGISLAQKDGRDDLISKWWVLLDTCSSATTVCNKDLIGDVRDATADEQILLHSDAGTQLYDKIGMMKDFPLPAMYNAKGIANVVSLKDMASIPGARIRMDTSVDPGITVDFKDGKSVTFRRCDDGLHYLDLNPKNLTNSNTTIKERVTEYPAVSFNQYDTPLAPSRSQTHVIPAESDDDDSQDLPSENQGARITRNNEGITRNTGANPNKNNEGITRNTGANKFVPHNHNHLDLITTVQQNQKEFSKQEINKAIQARHLQQNIGWPSKDKLLDIISKNQLKNCNTTIDDVLRAEYIFGTPVPLIKGKATRPPSTPSYNLQKVNIPLPILQHHSNIDLFVDFMYVNRIPFLHTVSSKIGYRTTIMCESREKELIIKEVKRIIAMYKRRGFNIKNMHGDNEFNIDEIIEEIKPTETTIYPPNEHVKEVERSIRTMKERGRCICHAIPFTMYTKLMTKHLVKTITRWLNEFPSEASICKTMSPVGIIEGKEKPDMNKKRLPFGSYAVVYSSTTNNMKSRGIEAIALSDVGNGGGHYFMNLATGKQIHGYDWTSLPITEQVIDRVHDLAMDEKQPSIKPGEPTFEWTPGVPITYDELYDNEEIYENNNQDENLEILDLEAADNDNDYEEINNENNDDNFNNYDDLVEVTDEDEDEIENEYNLNNTNDNDDINDDTTITDESDDIMNSSNEESDISMSSNDYDEINVTFEEESDNNGNDEGLSYMDESSSSGSEYNDIPSTDNENTLPNNTNDRPRRENAGAGISRLEVKFGGKTYDDVKTQFTQKKEILASGRWSNRKRMRYALQLLRKARESDGKDTFNGYMNVALNVMFTQMTAKRGIKLFGEEAIAAIYKEYKQLDEGAKKGNPVVSPTPWEDLTDEDKRKALDAVNLIKQKRCGKIKGRCAANGSRQREYLSQDETVASPTVSLEGLVASLVIDAKEERCVNTFDVPGAFLQAPMPEEKKVLLKLKGEFVDIMCRVNPEHLPNVRYEKNVKVLYLKVERAIYGCIESALMWYNMFTGILEEMGFKLNPYDKCVANKWINGKQCTIVWYVDDVKVSHVDQKVLDEITDKMQEHFGPMDIIKGDTHAYLGMNITIHREKKVIEIEMKQQLLEALEAFEGEIKDEVASPAAKHIFDTRDGVAPKLSKEKADNFHHVTAKLLHIMKRARPDIEIPIVFLCTRVRSPDEDDWKKLQRVLAWIKCTIDETRFIGADDLKRLYTWVDAAYAVHPNMRSHTGGVLSMGTGVVHCKSSRQKLNTKSSTEAELVGVSDYLPYNVWLMHFMKEQGYEIEVNVLYQDNQSAMKMEKNGRNSCTGNSRHVNIRYFWVKDRIEKGEIDLRYCPTEKMLADYFTKALQGAAFMRFWYVVMGHKHINSLQHDSNIEIEDSNIEEREDNTTENE